MNKRFIMVGVTIVLFAAVSIVAYANEGGGKGADSPYRAASLSQEAPRLDAAQKAAFDAEIAKYPELTEAQIAKLYAIMAELAQAEARYGLYFTDDQIATHLEYYIISMKNREEWDAYWAAKTEEDLRMNPNPGPYVPDPDFVLEGKEILDAYAETVQEAARAYREAEKETEQILRRLFGKEVSLAPYYLDTVTSLPVVDKECLRLAAQAINTMKLTSHEKEVLRTYIAWNMCKELVAEPFYDDLVRALYS